MIICIKRKNYDIDEFLKDENSILSKYKNNIISTEDPVENMISSSLIRRQIQLEKSIKYLVHDDVIDYIYDNSLYF